MEWIIVTDSGCDLLPGDLAPNVRLRRVPLSILLGEEEWVDGPEMDRARFLAAMEAHKGKSSSACPSPETWARAFSEGDNVIAINTQAPEFDALSCLQEGDVFLAISMPRYLKTTTQALALAYQSGIPTIAITDRMSSPLIPYATVPLLVDNEIFSYSDNIVPVTSAVTALLNAVGAATQPKSNEILARNEQVWAYFDLYLQ